MVNTDQQEMSASAKMLSHVSMNDLEYLMEENPSLRGYLKGYIAELFLRKHLETIEGISDIRKIPDHSRQKGDFEFTYNERKVTIELKSARKVSPKAVAVEGGVPARVVLSRTDAEQLENGETTFDVPRGEFDILAICSYELTGSWDFRFIHHRYLESSDSVPGRIKSGIRTNLEFGPCLHQDLVRVLNDLD